MSAYTSITAMRLVCLQVMMTGLLAELANRDDDPHLLNEVVFLQSDQVPSLCTSDGGRG